MGSKKTKRCHRKPPRRNKSKVKRFRYQELQQKPLSSNSKDSLCGHGETSLPNASNDSTNMAGSITSATIQYSTFASTTETSNTSFLTAVTPSRSSPTDDESMYITQHLDTTVPSSPLKPLEELFTGSDCSHLSNDNGYLVQVLSQKDNVEAKPFPTGNFICSLGHFIQQIRQVEAHTSQCLYGGQLVFRKVTLRGLSATLNFVCSDIKCSANMNVDTEETKGSLNKLSVLGAISTGSGFAQEEEIYNCMNIMYMSGPTFHKCEQKIGDILKKFSEETMLEAINQEIKLAEERNDCDANGYYHISAIVDGGWCKRSYGHGYNASSGYAVIIGMMTKKIIFMGVRNKLCMTCTAISKGRRKEKRHFCFKNWNYTSTGMESDIIVEGLNYLQEFHKVQCTRLVGDGDANTMAKVHEKLSYGKTVQKIECANHACRRYRRALEKIQKATHEFTGPDGLQARKLLASKIPQLVTGARTAIRNHAVSINSSVSRESADKLISELQNGPHHVFGKHDVCGEFCEKKGQHGNLQCFDLMMSSNMLTSINAQITRILVKKAGTLIYNATNNPAETFMSLMCKAIGGKRVDYSKAGEVGRRAHAAVLAYQRPIKGPQANVIKAISGKSPGSPFRLRNVRTEKKRQSTYRQRLVFNPEQRQKKKDHVPEGGDASYGDNVQKEDVDEDTFKELFNEHLQSISVRTNSELEEVTRGQASSARWAEERRKRIPSSFFKEVATRKPCTLSSNLVKRMLFQKNISTAAMKYGREHEEQAREVYEHVYGVKVLKCGLFVDHENCFLCTSPDGLVGSHGLLEIKCPFTARNSESFCEVAKNHNIGLKYKDNGTPYLPLNHKYYYQIQGQLAITGRTWCDIMFWTEKKLERIRIDKDTAFWEAIVPKLKTFYMKCVLPEIVDSRHLRGMPLREPQCILDEIEGKAKKDKQATVSRKRKKTVNEEAKAENDNANCAMAVISTPSRPKRHIVAPNRLDL